MSALITIFTLCLLPALTLGIPVPMPLIVPYHSNATDSGFDPKAIPGSPLNVPAIIGIVLGGILGLMFFLWIIDRLIARYGCCFCCCCCDTKELEEV